MHQLTFQQSDVLPYPKKNCPFKIQFSKQLKATSIFFKQHFLHLLRNLKLHLHKSVARRKSLRKKQKKWLLLKIRKRQRSRKHLGYSLVKERDSLLTSCIQTASLKHSMLPGTKSFNQLSQKSCKCIMRKDADLNAQKAPGTWPRCKWRLGNSLSTKFERSLRSTAQWRSTLQSLSWKRRWQASMVRIVSLFTTWKTKVASY